MTEIFGNGGKGEGRPLSGGEKERPPPGGEERPPPASVRPKKERAVRVSTPWAARIRGAPVTAATIAASVAVTVAYWRGADVAWALPSEEPLRQRPFFPLASTLVHGGPLHLFFNAYWTWALGAFIERVLGSLRTLLTFAFLGYVSAAAQWALYDGGIGLSGVVYGLFGFLWLAGRYAPQRFGRLHRNVVQVMLGWFVLCIILTELDVLNIGNVAHGSGLLLGAALGLGVRGEKAHVRRSLSAAASTALVATALLAATVGRPYLNRGEGRTREYVRRAVDRMDEGDLEAAIRELERALERSPENAELWYVLGDLREQVGEASAGEAYRRALETGGQGGLSGQRRAHALRRVADEEAERGELEGAAERLEEAVTLVPGDARAWRSLAEVRAALGEPEAARDAERRAATLGGGER